MDGETRGSVGGEFRDTEGNGGEIKLCAEGDVKLLVGVQGEGKWKG